ncbi:MAG: tRNA lysidine(34) synthetase, partial [Litorimonas sp.]
ARLGHELIVQRWEPGDISTGLQEKARRARYGLMGRVCRARAVPTLVTAHHDDDQAETVLMRLQRGSGWRGAAGMAERVYAPVWPELAGIRLVRPALGTSREALHRHINGQRYIDDPSNRDATFDRVRARAELFRKPALRHDMIALSREMRRGLEVDRTHMARQLRGLHLTHEGLLTVPRQIDPHTLSRLAPIVGGTEGPGRETRIADKMDALASRRVVSIGHGCLARWNGDALTLSRDPVAMQGRRDGNLAASAVRTEITRQPAVWDGRFLVSGEGGLIRPERRGQHVGYRVLYGRNVRVENLVEARLEALLTGM